MLYNNTARKIIIFDKNQKPYIIFIIRTFFDEMWLKKKN